MEPGWSWALRCLVTHPGLVAQRGTWVLSQEIRSPTFSKGKGDPRTPETTVPITNRGSTESCYYCTGPFKMPHTHA